jgi:hypothetical protein
MKKADPFLVVGVSGIVLVAALVLAGLAGLGGGLENPNGRFFLLLRELGYRPRLALRGEGLPPPATTLLVRLGQGEAGGETAEGVAALRGFVEAGGVLLVAGRNSFFKDLGVQWLDEGDALPLGLSPGLAEASAGGPTPGVERPLLPTKAGFRMEAETKARVLAATPLGASILDLPLGRGRILAFADEGLFSDAVVLEPEAAAIINAVLAPFWGRNLVLEVGSGGQAAPTALFRVLRSRAGALVGFQLLLLAALAGLALSVRFGPLARPASERGRGSGSVAESFGGFYRRSRAYEGSDALLAAAFGRRLARALGGQAAEQGSGSLGAAAAEDLALLASRRTGLEAGFIRALMSGEGGLSEKRLVAREKKRQTLLDALPKPSADGAADRGAAGPAARGTATQGTAVRGPAAGGPVKET